ncbi:MAG: hypothetical protein K9G76_02995 [Bacteroidales bacterium]|nr:hypothetical protein [Bacteroidales bacterium]MCF8402761.1 hypothetical protein [Bacteroidales bacterium]
MKASIDISFYPLRPEFVTPILDFIKRLNTYEEIEAVTNGMSTQVFGEYYRLMEILTKEIGQSFELPHSVFILKIINADLKE